MSDSVTISLLPVSLSIVHVPRSRIHSLYHPLLRQLLLPNPTFLNITCNEIELTLFAEHHALQDFEPLVKKDSRKMKMRGRACQPSSNGPKRRYTEHWEPIEMSAEKWNVFQIDSHSSGLGTVPSLAIAYSCRRLSFPKIHRVHAYMNFLHHWLRLVSLSSTSRRT